MRNKPKYYVFGSTNIDIKIKPNTNILEDSNPSSISHLIGGVGQNIAKNLYFHKEDVTFVTVIGNDNYKEMILADLNGITVPYFCLKNVNNSLYVSILNKDNELEIGYSDCHNIELLTVDDIAPIVEKIHKEDIVIIDGNVSLNVAEYLLKGDYYKVFDGVSVTKTSKFKDLLPLFSLVKLNKKESEVVDTQLLNSVIISLGNGVRYLDKNTDILLTHETIEAVNVTGCGDALISGFLTNFSKPLIERLKYSILLAVNTALVDKNVVEPEQFFITELSRIEVKK